MRETHIVLLNTYLKHAIQLTDKYHYYSNPLNLSVLLHFVAHALPDFEAKIIDNFVKKAERPIMKIQQQPSKQFAPEAFGIEAVLLKT